MKKISLLLLLVFVIKSHGTSFTYSADYQQPTRCNERQNRGLSSTSLEDVRSIINQLKIALDKDSTKKDSSVKEAQPYPKLTRQNAYVLFPPGYRTWVIVNGKIDRDVYGFDFDTQMMKEYLPFAQSTFKANPKIQKFSIKHSNEIDIVIQRPENEEDLQKEIVIQDWEKDKKEFRKRVHKNIENSLIISPNPTTNLISAQFEYDIYIKSVDIISSNGHVVKSQQYAEPVKQTELPISDLEPGYYIIKVVDHLDWEFSKPFIKQ